MTEKSQFEDASRKPATVNQLKAWYREYLDATDRLLRNLNSYGSQKDPIPEIAEQIIAAAKQGTLADSPVQPDWDVRLPDGKTIQVRSLRNTSLDRWTNEHTMVDTGGFDYYALVVFINRKPKYYLWVPMVHFAELKKLWNARGKIEDEVGVTSLRMRQVMKDDGKFNSIGVYIHQINWF